MRRYSNRGNVIRLHYRWHEKIGSRSNQVDKSNGRELDTDRDLFSRFLGPATDCNGTSYRSARVPRGFPEQRDRREDAGRNENSSQTVDSYAAQWNCRATKCEILRRNCSVPS